MPQSTWDSQAASRQDFYGKVDLGKPSDILLEQLILETLDEINERLKPQNFDLSLTHCFTLNGKPVKSIMDIHV